MPTYPEISKKLKRSWNRNARMYDLMSLPMEHHRGFAKARAGLFEGLDGRVLELGVGTGRSIPHYPKGIKVIAIDISKNMLARAADKAQSLSLDVPFAVADVEDLPFKSGSFDAVVGTGIFCCVPDQIRGFNEVRRVLKKGGKVILVEHIRPKGLLGRIFDFIDPIVSRFMGPHINRQTLDSVKGAGFTIVKEEDLFSDWVKFIVAL